jgi:peptidoglycan/LPS O-acetylase OafA/YrhL
VFTLFPAQENPLYFIVFLVAAILVSTASYLMIEKPTRDAIRSYFEVS